MSSYELTELMPPDALTNLGDALRLCTELMAVTIDDDLSYEHAGAIMRNVRNIRKSLEQEKRSITSEWTERTAVVNEHYKPVVDTLYSLEDVFGHDLGKHYGKLVRAAERRESSDSRKNERRRQQLQDRSTREIVHAQDYRNAGKPLLATAAEVRATDAQDEADYMVVVYDEVPRPPKMFFSMHWECHVRRPDEVVEFCLARPELRHLVKVDKAAAAEMHRKSHGNLVIEGMEFTREYRPIVQGDK